MNLQAHGFQLREVQFFYCRGFGWLLSKDTSGIPAVFVTGRCLWKLRWSKPVISVRRSGQRRRLVTSTGTHHAMAKLFC